MTKKSYTGFTLLELLIVVVILGVIALIATSMILNAAEQAKKSAVMANASAAASTVTFKLTIDPIATDELCETVVEDLNDPDGEEDSGDEIMSPFNKHLEGFTIEEAAGSGQVSVIAESDIIVRIRGYGREGSSGPTVITKVVSTLDLE